MNTDNDSVHIGKLATKQLFVRYLFTRNIIWNYFYSICCRFCRLRWVI